MIFDHLAAQLLIDGVLCLQLLDSELLQQRTRVDFACTGQEAKPSFISRALHQLTKTIYLNQMTHRIATTDDGCPRCLIGGSRCVGVNVRAANTGTLQP
jgi:hypothetical protein